MEIKSANPSYHHLFTQSWVCRSDLVVSQGKARADSLFDKSLPGAGKGEAEGAKLFHRTSNVSIRFIVIFPLF